LATTVPRLPDPQAAPLLAAYAARTRSRRLQSLAILVVLAGLVVVAGVMAEVRPTLFFAKIGNLTSFISRTAPPLTVGNFFGDIAAWYWNAHGWLSLLLETLLIAYLGTLLGALGGFALCFFASENLTQHRAVRFAARRFLEFCRTVPDIVFALIFVIAFGLGPMAGVLALAIHTVGALGKLFAEVVENIDMKPVEGLKATGATWVETVRFAVLPQVLSGFSSYALLRFEINVRSAGVMGFVGAGGIGQEFLHSIRNFYYTDVSAILVLVILTVVVIDLLTEQLRHRLAAVEGLQ
jgi:phosphonate transport system permease protein